MSEGKNLFIPEIDVDYLYQIADVDGDGMIGTTDALEFFQFTRLERSVLSMIWSLSVPLKKPMDMDSFITALRYCYYAQQGIQLSKELLSPNNNDNNDNIKQYPSPTIDCPYVLSEERLNEMESEFMKLTESRSGKITKKQLFDIVITSEGIINVDGIMKLCDMDNDGELDIVEFILAMSCIKYTTLFNSLPQQIPSYFISTLVCFLLDFFDCSI